MNDIHENIEEYNPNKGRKILIIFDDTIADTLNNKNPQKIVTELFISGRKLNISLVFITQFHFTVSKYIGLNYPHNFVMKIPHQ